jgi:O-antigen/teichoic acid export membrane protein
MVQLAGRIIRNTSFTLIAEVLGKLIFVFFIAYAARVLGPRNFGIYALIGTFTSIFTYFTDLGITPVAVREIARNKEKAEVFFNNALSLRICFIFLSYFLLLVIVHLLNYSQEIKYLIYVMGASLFFTSFSHSFAILYIAFERMVFPSLVSVLSSFLIATSYILVLYLGYGLKGLVWIHLAGSFMGAIISGIWIRKRFFKYRFTFNPSFWIDIIKQSMPFGIIAFFRQAGTNLTILLLSKIPGPIAGEMAMGYFKPASSTAQIPMMVTDSFRKAVLPTISSNRDDLKLIRQIIDRSTQYILVFVSLPLILAATFFPKEILGIVFGGKYLIAAPALTLLGWAYSLQAFNSVVQVSLTSSREIRRFIPWAAMITGVDIILAVPLIIYYSFVGAAIAVLVSMVAGTFVRYHLLKSVFNIGFSDLKESNRAFIPMALVIIIAFLLSKMVPSRIVLLFFILSVYIGVLYFFRILRYKELASIKDALLDGWIMDNSVTSGEEIKKGTT